jgi:phytoene dehydrogenase-like protein
VIHGIERFIPGISSWIEVCQVATPPTLVKYTSNYSGAMYGWASTREQVGFEVPGEVFGIHGLVMVGHWSDVPTGHSGIATVVASGRSVSRLVLRRQQRAVLS